MKKVLLILVTAIGLGTLLFSCVSGSYIIAGDPRPATSPTAVKIYFDPPEKYETLGSVEASLGNGSYKRQKTQDKVIKKLKLMAAKIGANGILLTTTGDKTIGTTGGYYRGYYGAYFRSSAYGKRVAEGRAIYVIGEPKKVPERAKAEIEAGNDLESMTFKVLDRLKYDGYSVIVNKVVDLKQRESNRHARRFYGGVEYTIICFSADPNVLDIGVYLERMDGTMANNYPTDRGEMAMIYFKPKTTREMKVVTTNLSSNTPNSESKFRIIIAFKE